MVGAAQCKAVGFASCQRKEVCGALFLCGSEGSGPGCHSPVRHHSATEQLGNSLLFYRTDHLSTLVQLPGGSPETAMVWTEAVLPRDASLGHANPPPLAPGAQPAQGLRAPLSQQECCPEMEQLLLLSLPNLLGRDHNERNEH